MKINPIGLQAIQSYKKQTRAETTAIVRQTFADHLEISSKAKEMQATNTYSAERAEKIKQLKADIDSGTYKVDAKKVAEDMLKFYRR